MTTLHKIITGLLLQRRYPIHFYVEFLIYMKRGFEELHFDSLGAVNSKLLPVNEYGAIPFPCGYMDLVGVYFPNGQYRIPLTERPGLNKLNNFDTNGDIVPFGLNEYGHYPLGGIGDFTRFNDHLENVGRRYGSMSDGIASFIVAPKRKEIQINGYYTAAELIVDYITDGTDIDSATSVDPYAIAALEAFAMWKHKENSRSYGPGEVREAARRFGFEHGILRGRKGPSMQQIRAAFNRSSHGSPK